jgi:predicted small lipoprotein YifL
MRFLAGLAAVLLLTTGCGQRGSLYLHDQPPPGVKPPRGETYQPVPYPPDAERDSEKKP